MSELPIPATSLARLRAAYQQFMDLATVVSEAMGIPDGQQRQLVMERGVFVLEDGQAAPISPPNGLAEEAHAHG